MSQSERTIGDLISECDTLQAELDEARRAQAESHAHMKECAVAWDYDRKRWYGCDCGREPVDVQQFKRNLFGDPSRVALVRISPDFVPMIEIYDFEGRKLSYRLEPLADGTFDMVITRGEAGELARRIWAEAAKIADARSRSQFAAAADHPRDSLTALHEAAGIEAGMIADSLRVLGGIAKEPL